jgi:MFS family permease
MVRDVPVQTAYETYTEFVYHILGMGAAGLDDDAHASNAANTTLYATFAVVGFFAGTITNVLGIRVALSFGGLGYCIYVSALLCFNITQNLGYVVFSGFLLGCCAGILWSAQGAIMMSYPPEKLKGRYISWFWIIFNMGAVIGGLVSLISVTPVRNGD